MIFSFLLGLLPLLLVILVFLSNEVFLGDCHSRLHPVPAFFLGDGSVFILHDVRNLFIAYTLPLVLEP